MTIEEMRYDISKRSKKGISFILASVVLWTGISIIWLLPIKNILTKNLFTFCCTAPLLPLAFGFSKIIKAEFSSKNNPLNSLGLLFSMNQMLYLLIAMWAFAGVPEKMVMIIAIIFGAHLLPFSWLYHSKAYLIMSIIISISITVIGWNLDAKQAYIIPVFMIFVEIIFSIWLFIENKSFISQAEHYNPSM